MWKISVTDEFKRRYSLLSLEIKKKAEKQERLFRYNPFYPSLHTEKLEPKGKQIWTIRIDSSYRIAFKFVDKDTVAFMTVGTHDWIYKVWLGRN
jgi:mRNA-degrading endonuclease RelE of RelBE toxin-antitoxin system